jgi:hypothetical protein
MPLNSVSPVFEENTGNLYGVDHAETNSSKVREAKRINRRTSSLPKLDVAVCPGHGFMPLTLTLDRSELANGHTPPAASTVQ